MQKIRTRDAALHLFRLASGDVVLLTAHDRTQVADGPVKDVLNREKLEALYRAPVERLVDPESGAVAFLPG